MRSGLIGFKPQELANTAWAFATAGVRADALYAAVAEAAVRSGLIGFNPQDLANTAWAFATVNAYHPALLVGCARAITNSLSQDPGSWGPEALIQLHQWQLWLTLERCEASDPQALLSESQRQFCRNAMQAAEAHPSRLQRAVAGALAQVCPGFEEEVIEQQTAYSLDLALRSSQLAIEVDGPSHFLLRDSRSDFYLPNGPTLLKRRLLEAAGWRVVSVPFYEWNGLREPQEQREYLDRRLGAVGLAVASGSVGTLV